MLLGKVRTTVPRLATLDPAARTRARTTLPKLPSPISLSTSKRSSNATALESELVIVVEESSDYWRVHGYDNSPLCRAIVPILWQDPECDRPRRADRVVVL